MKRKETKRKEKEREEKRREKLNCSAGVPPKLVQNSRAILLIIQFDATEVNSTAARHRLARSGRWTGARTLSLTNKSGMRPFTWPLARSLVSWDLASRQAKFSLGSSGGGGAWRIHSLAQSGARTQ